MIKRKLMALAIFAIIGLTVYGVYGVAFNMGRSVRHNNITWITLSNKSTWIEFQFENQAEYITNLDVYFSVLGTWMPSYPGWDNEIDVAGNISVMILTEGEGIQTLLRSLENDSYEISTQHAQVFLVNKPDSYRLNVDADAKFYEYYFAIIVWSGNSETLVPNTDDFSIDLLMSIEYWDARAIHFPSLYRQWLILTLVISGLGVGGIILGLINSKNSMPKSPKSSDESDSPPEIGNSPMNQTYKPPQ